jgi:hypothetical protein
MEEGETAYSLFEQHFQLLQDCYRHFWAAAIPAVYTAFQLLTNDEKTQG